MPNEPLMAARDRVSAACLGRAGVHGIGVKESRNAVRLYVAPTSAPDLDAIVDRARELATPFEVMVTETAAPTLHADAD